MKTKLLLLICLVAIECSWAQKQSRYKTYDNEIGYKKEDLSKAYSLSFHTGWSVFKGDMDEAYTGQYIPNSSLAIKLNKRIGRKVDLQFGIMTGRLTAQRSEKLDQYTYLTDHFKSDYLMASIASRIQVLDTEKVKLHITCGGAFYDSENKYTASITTALYNTTTEEEKKIQSIAIPTGLDFSYSLAERWALQTSFINYLFLNDEIDLIKSSEKDPDNMFMVQLGLSYNLY